MSHTPSIGDQNVTGYVIHTGLCSQWRCESCFSEAIASGFWGVVVAHNLIKPTHTISL